MGSELDEGWDEPKDGGFELEEALHENEGCGTSGGRALDLDLAAGISQAWAGGAHFGKGACTVIAFGTGSGNPVGKDPCAVMAFGTGSGGGMA